MSSRRIWPYGFFRNYYFPRKLLCTRREMHDRSHFLRRVFFEYPSGEQFYAKLGTRPSKAASSVEPTSTPTAPAASTLASKLASTLAPRHTRRKRHKNGPRETQKRGLCVRTRDPPHCDSRGSCEATTPRNLRRIFRRAKPSKWRPIFYLNTRGNRGTTEIWTAFSGRLLGVCKRARPPS